MTVLVTKHNNDIVVITIDRPNVRNAVDRVTAKSLADAFRAYDKDPEVVELVHHTNTIPRTDT